QREALHAGGGPGQQDGAMAFRQHAPGGLLRHQEGAEDADLDGALDVVRRQLDQRPAHPATGIVDDNVGRARLRLDRFEQGGNILGLGGVALVDRGAGLLGKRGELVDLACRNGDAKSVARKQARQRRAEAGAGADDQRRAVFWFFHRCLVARGITRVYAESRRRKGFLPWTRSLPSDASTSSPMRSVPGATSASAISRRRWRSSTSRSSVSPWSGIPSSSIPTCRPRASTASSTALP